MERVRRFTGMISALLLCVAIILACPLVSKAAAPAGGDVEVRISSLHAKLKITGAQEEQWNKVAQVMRENAATMEPLIKARKAKEGSMNAVDNLTSYSEIQDAHAAGLKNFIAAFEPLYASMSDDQKKIADQVFTGVGHHKKSNKK